jgi:hypothetical protein
VADAKRLQLLPVPLRMDVMDHYSGCCDCCSVNVSGLARREDWGMPAAAPGGGM